MAVSNVELIVNAVKAINPLRKVQQESKKVENGIRDVNGRLRDAKGRFIGAGQGANKASRAFDGLAKKAAGLAAAYLGLNAAQNAVRQGIQRIESERRIEFLAKGYGEVAQLQDAATKAAKRFGTGQTEANRALADVFARLRPVGVGLEDIVSVYNGFNTAARISGSTAVESANAFRQLSQALGSGALRGDEFNSISEQVPGILTAISKETGVAQGQLRKFAAEGGITADVVIRALKRIETEGAAQLEAALDGPAQAIADFQNAAEDVQVALTRDIVPQMAQVFRGLAELIVNLEGPIKFIGGVAADTLNQINSLITQATKPAAFAARRDIEAGLIPTNLVAAFTGGDVRGGAKELFGEAGLAELEERAREFSKLRGVGFQDTLLQFMQDRLKTMDAVPTITSSLTPPTLPTTPKPTTPKPTKARDAVEREDMSQGMLELIRERIQLSKGENAVAVALKENEIEMLEIQESSLLPRQRIARQLKAEEVLHTRLRDIHKENNDLFMEQRRIGEEAGKFFAEDHIKRAGEQTDLLKDALQGVGDILGNQLMNVFDGLINKTVDFNDVLRSTLSQVGRLLMTAGLNQLAGPVGSPGILSFLGFGTRANGGPVASGRPYIVGEQGPELFMPQQSGNITSNEDLRSLMGRSPAATNTSAMNFTFETTNIGGTEYVSREQLEAAMATTRRQAANDGAKRGMNMTLDRMQNSPRTRARVGIA